MPWMVFSNDPFFGRRPVRGGEVRDGAVLASEVAVVRELERDLERNRPLSRLDDHLRMIGELGHETSLSMKSKPSSVGAKDKSKAGTFSASSVRKANERAMAASPP